MSGSVLVYPFVVASTGWLAGIAATRCVQLAVAVEAWQIVAGHVYNWICEPVFQITLLSTTGGCKVNDAKSSQVSTAIGIVGTEPRFPRSA